MLDFNSNQTKRGWGAGGVRTVVNSDTMKIVTTYMYRPILTHGGNLNAKFTQVDYIFFYDARW